MKKPNLFIVGAAKAGTSSIYNYSSSHPDVYMSPIKEPNFFGSDIKWLIPEKLKKSLCQTLCYFMNLSLKTLLILILKIIFQNAQTMIGKKLINF